MIIGIYPRKSVYRDNSDSVEVQIKQCKDYAKIIFADQDLEFRVYDQDEGFSGKNTNRPSFQELMSDVKSNKLDVVMVYKLDRISRNVKEFSEMYDIMEKHGVSFLSVKESFDTSTPIGRTVMYILAAFAQLERENTSERVADNMLALGAAGRWTGGKLPMGMTSVRRKIGDKTHSFLLVDENNIPIVKTLYSMYLDGYTITKLERYCRDNGIKSPTGKYMNNSQIHYILSNPVYCSNDKEAYYYFREKGYRIPDVALFDGTKGLIGYGKTSQKDGLCKTDTWTISIGIHHPVIPAKDWIAVQGRFGQNKFFRSNKYEEGILKGVIRCSCGSRIDVRTYNQKGKLFSYYYCARAARQGKEYCDTGFIRTGEIDSAFLSQLEQMRTDPDKIIPRMTTDLQITDVPSLKKELRGIEKSIENLTATLMENMGSTASAYIIKQIEKLDKEKKTIESTINQAEIKDAIAKSAEETRELLLSYIGQLLDNIDSMSYQEINELIKKFIKSCIWDGENLLVEV